VQALIAIEKMKQAQIPQTSFHFQILANTFANAGDLQGLSRIMSEMVKAKRATKHTYLTVIKTLGNKNQAPEALKYFEEMIVQGYPIYRSNFELIVSILEQSGDKENAEKYRAKMPTIESRQQTENVSTINESRVPMK